MDAKCEWFCGTKYANTDHQQTAAKILQKIRKLVNDPTVLLQEENVLMQILYKYYDLGFVLVLTFMLYLLYTKFSNGKMTLYRLEVFCCVYFVLFAFFLQCHVWMYWRKIGHLSVLTVEQWQQKACTQVLKVPEVLKPLLLEWGVEDVLLAGCMP